MKNFLINLIFKSLTIENISALVAKCIVWLLEFARNKGDAYWDTAKGVIRKINNWCSLFLEVYEDDELTEEDEIKIANAIKNETDIETIAKILQKKIEKRGKTNRSEKVKSDRQKVKRIAKRIKNSKSKKQI